jgi:non-ribosomal peptide synthetase component F
MLFLSAWLHAECGIGPGDRMCHMADPGASTTMLEVWPALLAGATVVIMDEAVAADPRRITPWLAAERISALVAGEKAMDALADSPIRADAALRLVMTDLEQARRYPADSHFRLVATYGPEECGLVCSAHPVARNERPGGPHIGRPIAGAAIHILDESGRKVSAGEEGEMWIGGPGVGRGYRNRPDLTAERFVPDPFGDDPAGMIFRTGRRGRAFIGGVIGRSVPDRRGERRVGTH